MQAKRAPIPGRGSRTILCVVDRRRNPVSRLLRRAGYAVLETFTVDQAVALVVGNHVDCVVLDQEYFVETDGWSVAQSLKMVRPGLCVLLVSRAMKLQQNLPQGVDGMISFRQPRAAVEAVDRLLF